MRILLIKTSSLGDVVHNLPVVSDLGLAFPEAAIDWCVEENYTDVLRLRSGIADVIPVALRRWRKTLFQRSTWREMRLFRENLRRRRYDFILDTQGLLKSAVLARLTSGHRYGYAAEVARESLASRCYDETFVIPPNAHAVLRNRWLAGAAFGYSIDCPPDYGLRAPTRDFDWMPRGAAYGILFTACSRAEKLWSEASWTGLAQSLIDTENLIPVFPSGTPEERARVLRIAQGLSSAVIPPPLALSELAALIGRARIAVGVDTGLVHLAAALRTPAVALYTGSNPELTGLLGAGFCRNLGAPLCPPTLDEALLAVRQGLFENSCRA